MRFKNELVRNITIKLGYANAKVRRRNFSTSRSDLVYHLIRSINAKMKLAQDQDAIVHIAQTKKTIRRARDQDVGTA